MIYLKGHTILPVLFFTLPFFGLAQKAILPIVSHKVLVIAHRGDHTSAPENTLAAYQNAINDGADFIQIDLRTTKDSQLVIMHNENLNNMTGYDGEVKITSFKVLKTKKVRDAFYTEWGLFDIPTLKEVLQLCKGKINIYIDFKDAEVAETFKEIIDAGMENHVIIYVTEPHHLDAWKTIAPMIPLAMSLPGIINTKQEMNQLLDTFNIDILNGSATIFNEETISFAKQKQVPVWADAQSGEENDVQWKALLDKGFVGLQTDQPKALIKFLQEKSLR